MSGPGSGSASGSDTGDGGGQSDPPSPGDTRDDLAERRGIETEVYQPAEDSALLAGAGVDCVAPDHRVLEVGTGSGWVAERVADEVGARVVASDLNPAACRRARERAMAARREGRPGYEGVRGDLVAPFRDEAFDAVLFNPPYLPTDPDAEWDDRMELALSGGETGRAVIEPFLDAVGRVLAPDGFALLLVSSLTGFEAVLDLADAAGFDADRVRQESYPFEVLTILRLTPRSSDNA